MQVAVEGADLQAGVCTCVRLRVCVCDVIYKSLLIAQKVVKDQVS
jgi:hypothetical protein